MTCAKLKHLLTFSPRLLGIVSKFPVTFLVLLIDLTKPGKSLVISYSTVHFLLTESLIIRDFISNFLPGGSSFTNVFRKYNSSVSKFHHAPIIHHKSTEKIGAATAAPMSTFW